MARLRRSRIDLPGNRPRMIQKGPLLGADAVILDLKDSVIPEEKEAARFLVTHAIRSINFGETEVMVRINPLSTCGLEDLAACASGRTRCDCHPQIREPSGHPGCGKGDSRERLIQEGGYPAADRIGAGHSQRL